MSNPNPEPHPENLTRVGCGRPKTNSVRLQFSAPLALKNRLMAAQVLTGLGKSKLIIAALELYFDELKKQAQDKSNKINPLTTKKNPQC